MLFCALNCFTQNRAIDSLYKDLASKKADTNKAITLYKLSYQYLDYKPDSAMILARQSYVLSKKYRFLKGESKSLSMIASAYHALHNYPKAIENYIAQIKIEEKRQEPEGIGNAYLSIALVYNSEKEFKKALSYAKKAESLAVEKKLSALLLYSKLNIGDIYEKDNQLALAMVYANKAYELSVLQNKEELTGIALTNLGNIYFKQMVPAIALSYYKRSIPFLQAAEDYNNLSECYIGLAKVNQQLGRIDSAIFFAKQSYKLASENEFMAKSIDASRLLVTFYKTQAKIDSAFSYQEIMVKLTDSIDNKERAKQVQSITIAEDIRQREIIETREKEAEERKQKLQLLAIGVLIPIFFFISVFLSRRKVNKRVIEFSGVISLLMFFEYLTLFIHPFVAEKSHHSPLIEIVVFVIIASLITPAHHKIEHWLINKLSKIREQRLQIRQKQIDDLLAKENNEVS